MQSRYMDFAGKAKELAGGLLGEPDSLYGKGSRWALARARSLVRGTPTVSEELNIEADDAAAGRGLSVVPEVQRAQVMDPNSAWGQSRVMEGATSAAPIAVHAARAHWSGQPHGENWNGDYFGPGPYSAAPKAAKQAEKQFGGPDGSVHVWDTPDRLLDWDQPIEAMPSAAREGLQGAIDVPLDDFAKGGDVASHLFESGHGAAPLQRAGYDGVVYRGEPGFGGAESFVTFDPKNVSPLGTFRSVDEWLASDLYKQLKPRIDAEEALRASGKATPDAYEAIRRQFTKPQEK